MKRMIQTLRGQSWVVYTVINNIEWIAGENKITLNTEAGTSHVKYGMPAYNVCLWNMATALIKIMVLCRLSITKIVVHKASFST